MYRPGEEGKEEVGLSMNLGFRMHAERTPNPDSIKWVLGQPVTGDDPSAVFDQPVAEDVSPLASKLLGIDGVASVFLGPTFITVTRLSGSTRRWTTCVRARTCVASSSSSNRGGSRVRRSPADQERHPDVRAELGRPLSPAPPTSASPSAPSTTASSRTRVPTAGGFGLNTSDLTGAKALLGELD